MMNGKEKLLQVSLKLFMQRGYRGASIETITKAADITKSGFYYHFRSKKDLYYQVLQNYFGDRKMATWLLDHTNPDFKEFLWQAFQNVFESKQGVQNLVGSDYGDEMIKVYRFFYEATRRYPEFQQAMDGYDQLKLGIITGAFRRAQASGQIRRDLNPELLAFELKLLLQQIMHYSFLGSEIDDQRLKEIFENYWIRLV